MIKRCEIRTAAACLLVVGASLVGFGAAPAEPDKPAGPLPAEVVAAWKAAGAQVGWMKGPVFRAGDKGKAGEVPAFRFNFGTLQAGVLDKVPPPPEGFGLWIRGSDDDALKGLSGLKSLRHLAAGSKALDKKKVTDEGLKELAGLESLQSLDLGFQNLKGPGLKELAGLKALQSLNLEATKVTDEGVQELAALAALERLNLSRSKGVGDAGLKGLAGLKSLRELDLGATGVTDAGLKELGGLKSLQSLHLVSCARVTDKGLKSLAGLKSLRTLEIGGGTPVTPRGVTEIKKALPKLEVIDSSP
jgi:hypothetical protein